MRFLRVGGMKSVWEMPFMDEAIVEVLVAQVQGDGARLGPNGEFLLKAVNVRMEA